MRNVTTAVEKKKAPFCQQGRIFSTAMKHIKHTFFAISNFRWKARASRLDHFLLLAALYYCLPKANFIGWFTLYISLLRGTSNQSIICLPTVPRPSEKQPDSMAWHEHLRNFKDSNPYHRIRYTRSRISLRYSNLWFVNSFLTLKNTWWEWQL